MKTFLNRNIRNVKIVGIFILICILSFSYVPTVHATEITGGDENGTTSNFDTNVSGRLGPIQFDIDTGDEGKGLSATLQMLLVLTLISLAPSILIMVTSFTRIIIVLHFTRSALGTQTTPPNQVMIGLALFLTFFIMSPVITKINNDAIKPLNNNEITQEEAFQAGIAPVRDFMLGQIKQPKDLKLFMDIAGIGEVDSVEEIPTTVIIPAFIISELRTAFIIGFIIYIPFIIIDMVVASTLMSMGMMMLPPTTISMPFKILLFVMVDGWGLIIGEVVSHFY